MSFQKITIKDIAKKAGVSIATVSRYLNAPTKVKDETRKKLEKLVKEIGYEPSYYARKLAGSTLNTIGLIIPGYENIFYSFYALEIIRGVGSALEKDGLDLHLHIFNGKDNFKTSLVDGVIFADIIGNQLQFERLKKINFPLVVINKKIEDQTVSYVAVDNFKGGYQATEFLIQCGHTRIAHLAGNLAVECAKERFEGYKSALQRYNITVDDSYIKITNFSRREAHQKLEELFSLEKPPTAIFCCSDEVANEVLSFAENRGIKVPYQLSVIGFDDSPYCFYGSLALTTIRQPISKMASLGVEILKEQIFKKANSVKRIVLEPELVIRDTVTNLS